jgi:hypothetical protein
MIGAWPSSSPRNRRGIWGLRRRFPGAEVRTHERPWSLIVEVVRAGRTVALAGFDRTGGQREDVAVRLAA